MRKQDIGHSGRECCLFVKRYLVVTIAGSRKISGLMRPTTKTKNANETASLFVGLARNLADTSVAIAKPDIKRTVSSPLAARIQIAGTRRIGAVTKVAIAFVES